MTQEKNVNEEQLKAAVNKNDMVEAANDWLHPLEPYSPRKVLIELTRRWMTLNNPKMKTPLNSHEAGLLIQTAVSSQLNPFSAPSPEIWAWVTEKSGNRYLTIMAGRTGILRHANEKAEEMGHMWNEEYRKITDSDERAWLNIPDGAMAYECIVRDDVSLAKWTETYKTLRETGLNNDEILAQIGDSPRWLGIGVLTIEEMETLNTGTNKMPHAERCRKRSLMSGLKKKYNLPFGTPIGESSGLTFEDYIQIPSRTGAVEDAEFTEVIPEEAPTDDNEIKRRRKPQWWPPGVPEAIVDAGYATDKFNAAAILALSPFGKDNCKTDRVIKWCKCYRDVRGEVEDGKLKLEDFPTTKHTADEATKRYLEI